MTGQIAMSLADRRRLTGPGLRAFFALATAWTLTVQEQQVLLGVSSVSTLRRWRRGAVQAVGNETLERISLLLGIFQGINALLSRPERADEWMRKPNKAPIFGGRSALEVLLSGELTDLYSVRRYLDAQADAFII